MEKSIAQYIHHNTKLIINFIITLILWIYFTLGFVVFFSFFYFAASLFSKNSEIAFQRLNCKFHRGFFLLTRVLIPMNKWNIYDDVADIKSSIIVCNHISYLDPLILISLFEKHKTIVKSSLFTIPIFGQILKLAGYIPSTSRGKLSKLMIRHIEKMDNYLSSGGNFFVFPEGTRSRNGKIGHLNKGVFKIAKQCKSSIKVLHIQNTDKLFQPGNFLFNTCIPNTVTIELLATIEPDYQSKSFSISKLMEQVKTLLSENKQPVKRRDGDIPFRQDI